MAGINIDGFISAIDKASSDIQAEISALDGASSMDAAKMMGLQFQMNLFSQFMESITNMIAVHHEANKNFIRNLK